MLQLHRFHKPRQPAMTLLCVSGERRCDDHQAQHFRWGSAIFLKSPLPRTKGALVCDERLFRGDVTLSNTGPDWDSNDFMNDKNSIFRTII